MATDPQTSREIEELRRVLLKPEALVDRISPVIADILAEQITTSKDEIARALAPAIGEAIRQQVYKAREDIIDALYPVIGAMIARAATEAIRDLASQIDTRIRTGPLLMLDPGYWQARAQGISAGEYALRSRLPFSVQEAFLIQRDSGILICHLAAPGIPTADRDLVSGMLTAIRDFARDALGEGDELGAISYESRQIVIASGSAAYLAVVITGVEPRGFREELRQTLVAIHEGRYDRLRNFAGDDEGLVSDIETLIRERISLTTIQVDRSRPQNTFIQRAVLVFLLLIALTPLLLCGWWVMSVEARMATLFAPTATP
ncbi:MAG: SH3 domain-containing protein, partial [Chloroflexus sp.]|uniref:SH3 domain-containing protein n=1 Tax=Chloroflexus sp. TaxID=1904827 RepID=UPI00404A04F8